MHHGLGEAAEGRQTCRKRPVRRCQRRITRTVQTPLGAKHAFVHAERLRGLSRPAETLAEGVHTLCPFGGLVALCHIVEGDLRTPQRQTLRMPLRLLQQLGEAFAGDPGLTVIRAQPLGPAGEHLAKEEPPEGSSPRDWMSRMLQTKNGRQRIRKRKSTVEFILKCIKQATDFRWFLLWDLGKVRDEWALVCLGYNLRKLHKAA